MYRRLSLVQQLSEKSKSKIAPKFKMTPLEYIGVAGSAVFTWFVLSEIWKIFYTSFLGHAIGRTISVKKLGGWAGKLVDYRFKLLM